MTKREKELEARVAFLEKELQAVRSELAFERACYCDNPEDRLFHAADNTWWKRVDSHLYLAEPPKQMRGITRETLEGWIGEIDAIYTFACKEVPKTPANNALARVIHDAGRLLRHMADAYEGRKPKAKKGSN